jgi:hypothetical protein
MDESSKVTNGAAQYIALMDGIDEIGRTLREVHNEQIKLPDIKKKIATVKTSVETFSSDGYKFFGIITSQPQTLRVSIFGVNYDIPLDSGFNPVTLVDGVEYSSPVEFPCVFVWSSVEIGHTPVTEIEVSDIKLPAGKRLPVELPSANPFMNEPILFDQTIANGAELGSVVNVEGYSKVIVLAFGEAAYDVYSTPSPDGSNVSFIKETLITGAAANTGDSASVGKLAPYLNVTIKNNGASPAKFYLWVYGV